MYLCMWDIVSSYLVIGTERKAGAEEQGTPGGKREREQSGHRQTKILLLFLMTAETQRRGGLICSGVSEHMAALLLLLLAYLARAILHLENISPKVTAGATFDVAAPKIEKQVDEEDKKRKVNKEERAFRFKKDAKMA